MAVKIGVCEKYWFAFCGFSEWCCVPLCAW
jgi:hypothetical protein